MVTVPELVNAGNVQVAAAGGNVRLDVDPLLVALVSEHGQESGSNANGSWIRFANGVQICWGSAIVTFSGATNAIGTISLPAPFLTNSFFANFQVDGGANGFMSTGGPISASQIRVWVWARAGIYTGDRQLRWFAIGTWQ